MNPTKPATTIRNNWRCEEITELLDTSFNDLLHQAHCTHRQFHHPNKIQISTLLSIKTGACPEDCAYCPQSVHYQTGLEKEKLLSLEAVTHAAKQAKDTGAERFCMGAAWRQPTDRNLDQVIEMIQAVKDLGMETCVTLGMLTEQQATRLSEVGLDYYNHNLDTSPEFYGTIITTRTYQDRLDTLKNVRSAGIKVCTGGILGMGESREDRAKLLYQLATLEVHPESVPINMLVQIEGTPLYHKIPPLDPLEFVRTVAVTRILMPRAWIRLSAGRRDMSDEMQALCFFSGANSVFYGDDLLTTSNASVEHDRALFNRLGIENFSSPEKVN